MDPLPSLAAASIAFLGRHIATSYPLRAPLVRMPGKASTSWGSGPGFTHAHSAMGGWEAGLWRWVGYGFDLVSQPVAGLLSCPRRAHDTGFIEARFVNRQSDFVRDTIECAPAASFLADDEFSADIPARGLAAVHHEIAQARAAGGLVEHERPIMQPAILRLARMGRPDPPHFAPAIGEATTSVESTCAAIDVSGAASFTAQRVRRLLS